MSAPDIDTELRSARNAELNIAKKVLVMGRNPLINLAAQNQWTRSLLDLLRSHARAEHERNGRMPSVGDLDQFAMGTKDVRYYQSHGQDLISVELAEVIRRREDAGLWWPVLLEVSPDKTRYRIVKAEQAA